MANELKIRVIFDTGEAQASSKKYSDSVKYAEGTVGALESSLKKARLELKAMESGTAAHIAKLAEFKMKQAEVNDALGRGINVLKNTSGASTNAAMTLQSLNYTIRDAPYFARDFSLGLLAVGNNLNPLIDGFIRMKGELKEGQSLWGALTSSMSKAQWTILGFSAAVSIIQAVTFALAQNKSEAESQEKTINELAESFKTLEQKIKDTIDSLKELKPSNFQAGFLALQKELDTTAEKLKESIRLKQYYDKVFTEQPVSGQGYASFGAVFFAPSVEEQKKAEEEFKKNEKRYKELLRLGKLLSDTRGQVESGGDLKQFLKGVSNADLKFVTETFSTWKDSLTDIGERSAISFSGLGQRINFTKEEATNLLEEIEKIRNPKDAKAPAQTSAWDVTLDKMQGRLEDFAEKIKASLNLKKILEESAEGVIELPSTLEEINTVLKDYKKGMGEITELEILLGDKSKERLQVTSDTVAKLKRLKEEISDTSIEALMKGQMDKERKKDTTKVELENAKDVTQDISEYMKDIEDKQREINATANDVGNSLFNAFIQGKKGLDEFLESLGLAIAKMLIIKAITSLLGMPIGVSDAIPSVGPVNKSGIPLGVGPEGKMVSNMPQISTGGVSFNTNNKQIVQRLDALNANLAMLQPNVTVVSNVPGLEFTKQVTNKAQAKLTRGNIKNVV